MRTVFGFLGLLVVVAVMGVVAVKQLRGTSQVAARALPATDGTSATAPPTAGNVREQAKALGERVQGGVAQSLQQGAAARAAEAGK